MLIKLMSAGLSAGRQSIQQFSKSSWMGRSVTTLCLGCDVRCLNFIEASSKNTLCKKMQAEQDDACDIVYYSTYTATASDGSPDDPSFALLPKNLANPLYPFQKGLLKPDSMLHPAHPINWDSSSSDTSTQSSSSDSISSSETSSHYDSNDSFSSSSYDSGSSGSDN
jgi:hypothetical protein